MQLIISKIYAADWVIRMASRRRHRTFCSVIEVGRLHIIETALVFVVSRCQHHRKWAVAIGVDIRIGGFAATAESAAGSHGHIDDRGSTQGFIPPSDVSLNKGR